jgi:hypothetical protein
MARGPGLSSAGNRALLAVAVGWLAWLFAGALETAGGARVVAGAVAGAIAYGLATVAAQRPGQEEDGSDSSR